PDEIAYNSRGKPVGFGMPQLGRKYVNLRELFAPSFCRTAGITTATVADMFIELGSQLSLIHDQGIVIGDFNDGSILFHQDSHEVAWVDVDSWSISGHPCVVGT